MKPKTMILMVVAVACGLVASYMTSRLLAERNNQGTDNMVMVAFAKKKVPAFTAIKKPEDLFELRPVQESQLTAKAVKTLEELQGKRLNKPINEEQVVRVDDLQRKEDMILDIPVGQRAIAIRVNPETLAGGFILPGAHVDLISTTRSGNEPTSMIILQNMLVVAIDTKVGREDGQSTALGQTVTLAATPEECLRMSLAAGQGDLRLTLRSQDDKRLTTIGVARASDSGKPVRAREGDPNNPEGAGDASLTATVLPKLPAEPPPPTPAPQQEKPEAVVEEPPPAKTHTLVIQQGENIQRAIFTWDEDNQTWRNGTLTRNLEDDQPGKKPGKKPAAKVNQN